MNKDVEEAANDEAAFDANGIDVLRILFGLVLLVLEEDEAVAELFEVFFDDINSTNQIKKRRNKAK